MNPFTISLFFFSFLLQFFFPLLSCLLLFFPTFTHPRQILACYICWSWCCLYRCRRRYCCYCTSQCLFIYSLTVENCACIGVSFRSISYVNRPIITFLFCAISYLFHACRFLRKMMCGPKSFGMCAISNGADKCRHRL